MKAATVEPGDVLCLAWDADPEPSYYVVTARLKYDYQLLYLENGCLTSTEAGTIEEDLCLQERGKLAPQEVAWRKL